VVSDRGGLTVVSNDRSRTVVTHYGRGTRGWEPPQPLGLAKAWLDDPIVAVSIATIGRTTETRIGVFSFSQRRSLRVARQMGERGSHRLHRSIDAARTQSIVIACEEVTSAAHPVEAWRCQTA